LNLQLHFEGKKMQFDIHLSFNGQCQTAFEFYEKCLGGEITTMLTYGASPAASTAPGLADKIIHASLKLGNQTLSGVDLLPGNYKKPQGFYVTVNLTDPEEAERIFKTLADGGVVLMPLQPTFWAERFAVFTDRFGTPWEINCGKGEGGL
jgi:PhnB protein